MVQTLYLILLVGFVGFCECVAHQAVFVQDNPVSVHRGPIFRAQPLPQTTEKPKPTPAPLDCSIREDGSYLPTGVKCSRLYFVCAHGVSRFLWCPHDTVFNREKGECDHYDQVKDCPPINKMKPDFKPTPSSTTQSSTQPSTIQ